ncbi:ABC transporter permease [Bacillus sp. OxB-1]|uniref:methionine ABC transporter permease n=1 Tax=Bacillus sp. (strain OxB-1) TaxID=98228 RepID=UPI000581C041|nr:methionine ABC transporter permease [Bacillus sp. OxB-1]BAQ09363.1 ABC transporter permease [Bacillus sp. OxB-1]
MNGVSTELIIRSIYETIYMVSVSLLIGTLIGVPLGILLVMTRSNGIKPNRGFFTILNGFVNILRSVPFIILLVAITPLTRFIVGQTYGSTAAIVPLCVYIFPFIARLVENSLLEVGQGIIELSKSLGASTFQTIRYFLLPEAMGSLVLTLTTATIGLIGATAMAGTIGGGGVGSLAITYGYERFNTFVIFLTVIILIIIVQIIQGFGNRLAKKLRHE